MSRMPLLSASPLAAGSTDLGSEVPPMLVEDDSDDECDHGEDSENCPWPTFQYTREVYVRDGLLHCTCQWSKSVLLPCRHIICVKNGTVLPRDCHFRWSLAWQAGLIPLTTLARSYDDLSFGVTTEGVREMPEQDAVDDFVCDFYASEHGDIDEDDEDHGDDPLLGDAFRAATVSIAESRLPTDSPVCYSYSKLLDIAVPKIKNLVSQVSCSSAASARFVALFAEKMSEIEVQLRSELGGNAQAGQSWDEGPLELPRFASDSKSKSSKRALPFYEQSRGFKVQLSRGTCVWWWLMVVTVRGGLRLVVVSARMLWWWWWWWWCVYAAA